MINRLLIRIKTVQLVYSYMQGSVDRMNSDEEMAQAIESSYKLYNYLLALIVKLTEYRKTQLDNARNKFLASHEERFPNARFANNSVAKYIAEKSGVIEYCQEHELLSDFDTETYRNLLEQIESLSAYQTFMHKATDVTLDDEKELWKEIFAEVISRNAILDATLEEKNIYWNDDLATIIQFVIKAITQINPEREQMTPARVFDRKEDQAFARALFHAAIDGAHEYLGLIDQHAANWQVDRMAMMDKVVMICALAEIRNFPDIPVRISMNEYIELAKHYCAPDSARFVNGIVDRIVKQWKSEGIELESPFVKK